jgi:hypothetical protein
MPELPELTVVQEVLNRRILGQTVMAADALMPGAAIVIRDLTGAGLGAALAAARFDAAGDIARRLQRMVGQCEFPPRLTSESNRRSDRSLLVISHHRTVSFRRK